MKLRAGVVITQREVHSWNPYAENIVETRNKVDVKVRHPFRRAQPGPEQQQGKIGFFRTKLWAARIVERWEEDYGELDPEERDRKGGHLWWWTPPADDDGVGA